MHSTLNVSQTAYVVPPVAVANVHVFVWLKVSSHVNFDVVVGV